jgi:apolipoprotein N-acyltransferase
MHPEPAKSRTTRAGRSARGRAAGIAIVILACGGLLAACGSSKSSTSNGKTNLDTARVQHSIEQSILSQRHLRSKVVCPTSVPQEKGRTFECIATTETVKAPVKHGKTPFVVTIQNANGYVTYEGK